MRSNAMGRRQMDEKVLEILIRASHQAYVQKMKESGFHSPDECPDQQTESQDSKTHCFFCHPIIKPFEDLTEIEKMLYKRDLESLFESLKKMGFSLAIKEEQSETWIQIC